MTLGLLPPNSVQRCEIGFDGQYGGGRLVRRNGDGRWVDLQHNVGDTNAIDTETVPDVVAGDVAAADIALAAQNLSRGSTQTAQSTTVAIGDIIAQSPAAAATAFTLTTVDVLVSLGTAVPLSIGVLEATFLTSLTAAGLIAGTGTTANDASIPVGDIISSDPVSGTLVEPGSAVDYVTSLGPV